MLDAARDIIGNQPFWPSSWRSALATSLARSISEAFLWVLALCSLWVY